MFSGIDPKALGRYAIIGQVGFEMVAPIGLGYLIDYWLDWGPWLTIGGAMLGLVGGMAHLMVLARQLNEKPGDGETHRQT
jgi:F0F1-type ATP synthase assembly protein I